MYLIYLTNSEGRRECFNPAQFVSMEEVRAADENGDSLIKITLRGDNIIESLDDYDSLKKKLEFQA